MFLAHIFYQIAQTWKSRPPFAFFNNFTKRLSELEYTRLQQLADRSFTLSRFCGATIDFVEHKSLQISQKRKIFPLQSDYSTSSGSRWTVFHLDRQTAPERPLRSRNSAYLLLPSIPVPPWTEILRCTTSILKKVDTLSMDSSTPTLMVREQAACMTTEV